MKISRSTRLQAIAVVSPSLRILVSLSLALPHIPVSFSRSVSSLLISFSLSLLFHLSYISNLSDASISVRETVALDLRCQNDGLPLVFSLHAVCAWKKRGKDREQEKNEQAVLARGKRFLARNLRIPWVINFPRRLLISIIFCNVWRADNKLYRNYD